MKNEDEQSLLSHAEGETHNSRCSRCQTTTVDTYIPRLSNLTSAGIWLFTLAVSFLIGTHFPSTQIHLEDLGTGHRSLNKIIKLQREYHDLKLGEYTPYTESSGPEVDALWDEITVPPGKVGMMIVSKEELESHNLTSVPLSDGSGYIAAVDVFHQLHCLDMLRKNVFSPTGKMEEDLWREHMSHCIDSIRQNLQCHADTSILTFKWIANYSMPWPDFRTYRTCRDFDSIRRWAEERIYEQDRNDWVHPVLGLDEDNEYFGNPLERVGGVEYLDVE